MNSDLIELLRVLNQENIKYLIVGGYAFAFHAEPRYTKDIDILIATDKKNANAVYRALAQFGVPLDDITPEDFQNRELFYQIGLPPNRIDILMEIPGVDFAKAWNDRVEADIDGVCIKYICLDDLIVAKKTAGRDQDLIDVKHLEQLRREKYKYNQKFPERPSNPEKS